MELDEMRTEALKAAMAVAPVGMRDVDAILKDAERFLEFLSRRQAHKPLNWEKEREGC